MAALDQDIDTLVEISGHQVDRNQAAQVLKISSNDVSTAMNKIFDALEKVNGIADLLKQGDTTWDGTAFGGLGYGPYPDAHADSNLPTFNIDATNVDDIHKGALSAAPTRPPSRTSPRPGSAMSTHMGDVPMQSSFYSEDDAWHGIEPLTGFSGVEHGQESGVMGTTGTAGVLRPATQNYYDSAAWALVPATKSTELVPDASLLDQVRNEKPGFIKPGLGDNYLPALLTMLHSIPLARNALLAPEVSTANYWRGNDWWKGSASAPIVMVTDDTGTETGAELELLYEIQRLVAFLDAGERTYASIDAFVQLDAWAQPRFTCPDEPTNNNLVKFLMRWSWMYEKHAPGAQLDGIFHSEVNVNGSQRGSHVLDIDMSQNIVTFPEPTLYDYIDESFFTENGRAHITKPGDVLVLSLDPRGTKRNCRIPAVLFVDRYLEENQEAVETNFLQRKKYTSILDMLESKVEDLKYHRPHKAHYPTKMETLTLLKNSMKAFESDTEAMTESPRDVAVFAHLQALYEKVEKQLSELEEQKAKAKEALDGVADLFRAPLSAPTSDDPESGSDLHKFAHPYRLCGVSKSNTEYYICHPSSNSGQDDEHVAWWHIRYVLPKGGEDHASIEREQKSITEVLQDVSEVSDQSILVYASTAASSASPTPLSARLETFIKKDNASFQQEVATAEAGWLAMEQEQEQNQPSGAVGDWLQNDNQHWYTGDDGWGDDTSAKQGYQQDTFGSTLSSKTLTPNIDHNSPAYRDEDDVVDINLSPEHVSEQPMETQEINGGFSAWADTSNASSETVGVEPMYDVVPGDGRESNTEPHKHDTPMSDVGNGKSDLEEAEVEHIEAVEKKGG